MNRINPLHIVALLIVVLLFVAVQLSSAKDELIEVKEIYKETLNLSTELKGLNDLYSNSAGFKKSLDKILKHSLLKSSNIEKKVTKSVIVLSSKSMDKKAINLLMGKLLNASYNISSFKIKRLSEKNASFRVEIKC